MLSCLVGSKQKCRRHTPPEAAFHAVIDTLMLMLSMPLLCCRLLPPRAFCFRHMPRDYIGATLRYAIMITPMIFATLHSPLLRHYYCHSAAMMPTLRFL